jgi:hypothetical protein
VIESAERLSARWSFARLEIGGVGRFGRLSTGEGNKAVTVSIKDVAKMAGVSCSTVGRALDTSPRVNAHIKAPVRRLAAEFGYLPWHSGPQPGNPSYPHPGRGGSHWLHGTRNEPLNTVQHDR